MTEGPVDSESGAVNDDRRRVEQAIRDLRAGSDVDACSDFLFQRFSTPLIRQLISWGATADEARDLNQETFQRIFLDVENFQGEERLFESWVGWIWRIARTTLLRSKRFQGAQKRPQKPQPLEVIDQGRESVERPPSQLDQVLAREVEQRVRDAIGDLPEQERKCVILHYYQGLKMREISVILRIADGTVKAHLNHARAKLKTGLEGWLELDDRPKGTMGEPRV